MENLKKLIESPEFRKAIGRKLQSKYETNKKLRNQKEIEWLQELRQIKGIYDPGVVIDKDQSHVYPKMTRKYCRMVESRLNEMLFPDGDRNWDMEPSPEPSVSEIIVNMIAEEIGAQKIAQYNNAVATAEQNGEDPSAIPKPQVTEEEVELAIKSWCKETNRKMRSEIDDQLLDIRYQDEAKKVLKSGVEYGTGILKGPLVEKRKKRAWKQDNSTARWTESVKERELPLLSNVRIWDWYPDLTVTELKQTIGNFERHIKNKKELTMLATIPGFDKDFIRSHIAANQSGDARFEHWEIELQTIDAQMNSASKGETYKSPSGDTTEGNNIASKDKRYELYEYWGTLDAVDLRECGINVPDEESDLVIEVNVWGLGGYAVKIALAEGASDMYSLFYFEKDETSIYGDGLPRIMRHSQEAISASARMILDNGAVTAGPQMEVNHSLLMPGQNITKFRPRKLWWREGRGMESQWPAIRPIQFDSHITELKAIMDTFRQLADEETCLPTWMISSPSSTNETAQGSSMRMGMLSISVKDIVRNFDTFTEKVIKSVYEWNMDFNPRDDIKGDYTIRAKGVSSLVGKELRMQAMSQMRSVLQPEDYDYIPRRDFLVEMVKIHDLPITVRTEEEASAYRASITDPEIAELQKEQMRAEIEYRKSQALSMLAGAKKKNVDAEGVKTKDDSSDVRLKDSQAQLNQTKAAMMPAETLTKVIGAKNAGNKGKDRGAQASKRK